MAALEGMVHAREEAEPTAESCKQQGLLRFHGLLSGLTCDPCDKTSSLSLQIGCSRYKSALHSLKDIKLS